jgi:hypothetical protein
LSFLIATDDDGREVTVAIEDTIEIGRADETWTVVARTKDSVISLNISDATISRSHARIFWESGKLMLQDLGSKNGTYIREIALSGWSSGKESRSVEILDRAIIQFGYNTKLRIDRGVPSLNRKEWKQLTSSMSKKENEKMTNAFRLVLAINNDCCNTSSLVKEVKSRLDNLKIYLASQEYVDEVEMFQRRLAAESYEGQLLMEEHVQALKSLCIRLSELWCAKI